MKKHPERVEDYLQHILEAIERAIVSAFFVNNPSGGKVETVWIFRDHLR